MSVLDFISIAVSVLTLICTIITVAHGMKKQAQASAVSQALTDERIKELTREVRKHNNFAERMPVLEERIKVANHRIDDLEGKHEDLR